MISLLQYSAAWKELVQIVADRRSAILLGPKHYGKWETLEAYRKVLEADPTRKTVAVSSRVPSLGPDIDYSFLWDAISGQLGVKRRGSVRDRSEFSAMLKQTLAKRSEHTTIFVGGAGRGHEESHFRVVSVFQQVIGSGKISVVAVDDYSSFYFQKVDYLISDLHSLHTIQLGPSELNHIRRYLHDCKSIQERASAYLDAAASKVCELSGGHTGLAQELLHVLESSRWPEVGPDLEQILDTAVKTSTVLENIIHALEEDTEGYVRTALEYRVPTMPERNSARVQVLRQLGVLQRRDPPLLALCGGAVSKVVERLLRQASPGDRGRLGTVINEAGPRLFEEGPIHLNDDDIVLLHLSDLHVGDNYRYRLRWEGGQLNPDEPSAGDLIQQELESLSLLDRVDGIALTGDFVWNGKPEEFRRARDVIEEIFRAATVPLSKGIIVPGNHDVEWNPGSLASRSYGKAVSRESYNDFVELLDNSMRGEVVEVILKSRSGKHSLQVVGVDSNRVEGPDAAGIGFVSRESLSSARKLINDYRSSNHENANTWLAVHHHVFPATSSPLSDASVARVSTMANSPEVLEMANETRCELILHGHEHQPCVTVARRWPADGGETFAPTASIGAGSFGVKREYLGPFSRNQYFVIIRRSSGILLRSRAQGSTGVRFVPHSDIWLPR